MNREEKNQMTRRRIIDSALTEFAEKGYGASSINSVCAVPGISKGIIYHYFDSKDALFLVCVEECFDLLTEYIRANMHPERSSIEEQLKNYFSVRLAFFREHPLYQRIFCEAVIMPPTHLKDEIRKKKQDFDIFNVQILEQMLADVTLRPHITQEDVIEFFRQFQDFINAPPHDSELTQPEFEAREKSCRKALDILLYGVIERK